MKTLIATKSGGHSIQALGILSVAKGRAAVLTDEADTTDYGVKTYRADRLRPTMIGGISPVRAVKNAVQSLWAVLREWPDEVYCCGANASLFAGLWGKVFMKRVVAVEANNRIRTPSKATRLLSLFCDEVWMTHREQKGSYRGKGIYRGLAYPRTALKKYRAKNRRGTLVVLSSVDRLKGKNVAQNIPHEELLERMGKAKRVVARGSMTAWEAAQLADEVIVVPLKRSHEAHQKEFAEWLVRKFKNIKKGKSLREYVK
ncbi:MAG: hypothetical protein KAW41_03015 [Candidatus Diapherotrites archaeon]|nr:hypothetical protein [Candidatus Diapherotrites archaeon]